MSFSGLVAGIGLVIVLYVFVTFFLFNIFMLITPLLGCSPVGNGNSIFSFNFTKPADLFSSCPANSQVYDAMLIYIGIIILVLIIILGRIEYGYAVITLGVFIPSVIYAVNKIGYLQTFNNLELQVISMVVIIAGVILAWMD